MDVDTSISVDDTVEVTVMVLLSVVVAVTVYTIVSVIDIRQTFAGTPYRLRMGRVVFNGGGRSSRFGNGFSCCSESGFLRARGCFGNSHLHSSNIDLDRKS